MNLTPEQQTTLNTAVAVIGSVGPALGPNGAIVAALVSAAASALQSASSSGADVTDAELQAMFDQFDKNKADDLQAQAEAQGGPTAVTAGTPAPPKGA